MYGDSDTALRSLAAVYSHHEISEQSGFHSEVA